MRQLIHKIIHKIGYASCYARGCACADTILVAQGNACYKLLQKDLAHHGNVCIIKFMQQTTTNRRYEMETIPLYEVVELEVVEITITKVK